MIYMLIEIIHDMSVTYNLMLRQKKTWRAREQGLEDVIGDLDKSYIR